MRRTNAASGERARMTASHFYCIANAILDMPVGRITKAKIAVHMAGKLMRTNNNFKYWKFVEAATGENRYKLPRSITLLAKAA